MPLKGKKYSGIKPVLKSLKLLNFNSKGSEVKLIFNLVTSLSMTPENVKKIIKDKTIEEILPKLLPKLKSEKDILSTRLYLTYFIKFLSAFTYNEEGIKAITIHNSVFDLVFFCLENLAPPSPVETDTIHQLFINSMLFFCNSSCFRKNKLHFLSNPKFLTNVLTILDSDSYPLKVKAFTAQTLCVTMDNHTGVKASWGKQVLEGIAGIRRVLETAKVRDFDCYGSLEIGKEETEEFWKKQEKYRDICVQALARLV